MGASSGNFALGPAAWIALGVVVGTVLVALAVLMSIEVARKHSHRRDSEPGV